MALTFPLPPGHPLIEVTGQRGNTHRGTLYLERIVDICY